MFVVAHKNVTHKPNCFRQQAAHIPVPPGGPPTPRAVTPSMRPKWSSSQEASESAAPAHAAAHPLTSVTRKTAERGRGRSAHIEHTSIFNQKEISSPFALALVAHVVSAASETEDGAARERERDGALRRPRVAATRGRLRSTRGAEPREKQKTAHAGGGHAPYRVMQHACRQPSVLGRTPRQKYASAPARARTNTRTASDPILPEPKQVLTTTTTANCFRAGDPQIGQ